MKKAIIPVLGLYLALALALAPLAGPFWPVFGKSSPQGEQRYTVALSKGQTPSFAPDELERRLGLASGSLRAVTFTRLPDGCSGTLLLEGKSVELYATIPRGKLNDLTFEPVGDGPVSFTLLPDADGGVVTTLAYTTLETPNSPPVVQNASIATLQNVRRYGQLIATDPDGDRLSYYISASPKKGQVTLVGDTFIYTPLPGAKGKDQFTFYAQDNRGNFSDTGVVTIQIERSSNSPYFADLQGSRYEYAAVKLADAGVISGEQFGGSRLFYPDRQVTGGEMIVMILAAMGQDKNLTPCVNTGLEKDSEIPMWLKPYLSRAMEHGIINSNDFDPTAVLRRAEAVQLIYRASGIKVPQRTSLQLRDVKEIPTTALQAYMALADQGLLEHYDGYSTPAAPLERGYAAGLLWGLYHYCQ